MKKTIINLTKKDKDILFFHSEDFFENGYHNKIINLKSKNYEKIFKNLQKFENILNKEYFNKDLPITRVDFLFDKKFNMKISEINFDAPSMFLDIYYNQYVIENYFQEENYFDNFNELYLNLFDKNKKIFLLKTNYEEDYENLTIIKKILDDKKINNKIITMEESLKIKDSYLINFLPKRRLVKNKNIYLKNNIKLINGFDSFELEDKYILNNLRKKYKKSRLFLKTNKYSDKNIKKYKNFVVKPRKSYQGNNIFIYKNNEIVTYNRKKIPSKFNENYIIQDFFKTYEDLEGKYILTAFFIDKKISNFVFLLGGNIITSQSKTVPYFIKD